MTNGTVSALTGSGSSYGLTFQPGTNGAVAVGLPAATVVDAAGMPTQWPHLGQPTLISRRQRQPSRANGRVRQPFTVAITFTEAMTGFVVGDITATNASLSNFAGSGASYTCAVTPSAEGTVTLKVNANVATDATANNNVESNTYSVVYDTTAPTDLSMIPERLFPASDTHADDE